jgi:hypothetical protein
MCTCKNGWTIISDCKDQQQLLDYKALRENERYLLWQMDLEERFRTAVCEPSSIIAGLIMNTPYLIMRAVGTNIRFSKTIRIKLRKDLGALLNVSLPKIY